jgi:hypothetical protein
VSEIVDLPIVTARAMDVRLTLRGFDSTRAAETACAPQWRAAMTESELLAQLGTVSELVEWLRDAPRDWEAVDDLVELAVRLAEAEAILQLAREGAGRHLAGLYADADGAA